MADLSLTAASVLEGTGAVTSSGIAGATITAGVPVYLKNDGKYWPADANAGSGADVVAGIALHASLAGQPLTIQTSGLIAIGATVVVGGIYVLSANVGMIAPVGDLATGWYTSILGYAPDATHLNIDIINSGTAHA